MTNYQITLPQKTGYTFGGYFTETNGNGTQFINKNGQAINNLYMSKSVDNTLYAKWTINSYQITYHLDGGSNPSGVKTNYSVNDEYTLPTPTKTGYTFAGWYTASNYSGSAVSKINKGSTGNKQYYAKWNPNKYKVTLNNQGATAAGTTQYWYYFNTTKVIDGETIYYYTNEACTTPMKNYTITPPTKTGYTFAGYFSGTNGTGTQYIESTGGAINNIYSTKAENTTLYAKWTTNTYTLTYNANGGSVTPSSKTVTYNVEYGTLPTPTRTGYTFAGWYTATTGGTQVTSGTKVTKTQNHTIYARWTANSGTKFTVKYYKQKADSTYPTTPNETKEYTGTTGATISCSDYKKTYTGFTYSSCKNSSGTSITTTTIAADGSAVINIYYSQNYVKVVYHTNGATTIKFKNVNKNEAQFVSETVQYINYEATASN